jgi:hypothetical protein
MSLGRIYASKIYLTSNRQGKIHAAIQDPLNVELVQQISDYLDTDAKEELAEAVEFNEAKEASSKEAEAPEGNVFDGVEAPTSSGGPSLGGGSHRSSSGGSIPPMPSGGGDPFEEFESDEPDAPDDAPSDDNAPAEAPSEPPADIEEATEITGVDEVSDTDEVVLQSGVLKKLLNSEDDTSGVARVDIDDKETWVYYEDKVNLNDILDEVISAIKNAKYDMLKFSRLARTDNAVVFDIKE